MSNKQEIPQWIYKLQLVFGGVLIIAAIFLYYAVVPKGLDQTVPIVLIGFGILNLFFGRSLFNLPEKQKERAKQLKEEKEREQRANSKSKGKTKEKKEKK